MIKWLKRIFLILTIVPLIVLGLKGLEYAREDRRLAEVQELMTEPISIETETMARTTSAPIETHETQTMTCEETVAVEIPPIDLEALRQVNSDVIGAIYIEDTRIDYPVLDSEIPNYYIEHDFYGEKSSYGSIYIETLCDLNSPNILLYGHHMRNGAMFGELKYYLKEDYRTEHDQMLLILDEEVREYEVIAVFAIEGDDSKLLENLLLYTEEQAEKLSYLVEEQDGFLKEPFDNKEQYLTLITCEYTNRNGRLLVIGKQL